MSIRRRSQDMVDRPGPGALRRAGLRVGAAGGEGGRVTQRSRSAAGFHRGQAVHNAGETLQAGGSGCLVGQTFYRVSKKKRVIAVNAVNI